MKATGRGFARLVPGATATLVLALSACGSGGTTAGSASGTTAASSTGSEASGDAVAWADKVCESVQSEVGSLTQKPNIDTSTPESAKAGLISFMDNLGTALDRLIGGIKGAGDPPVPNGKQAAEETTKMFEEAKKTLQDAKAQLAQTPMDDPAAAKQAFVDVANKMTSLGDLDARRTLDDVPQLKDAFNKAPACQKLDRKSSSSSSAPTSTS
jgi:hypothetical protein